MRVNVEIPDEEFVEDYFKSCARIRGISVHALLKRLMRTIGQDQLIPGILDDQDEFTRFKGEWRSRETSA